MISDKIFNETQKTVTVQFVKDYETGKYIHSIEVVNPLVYGRINSIFVLWAVRKSIRHFIGFLDYSKDIDFCVCDNILGIRLGDGKVYTNKDGKIRFTLNY